MTRTQLAAAVLTAAAGGVLAQQPAAWLLPAQPVEATVSRGYAPDASTFGDTRPPVKTPPDKRSWTGAPLTTEARRPQAPPPPQQPPAPTQVGAAAGVYAGPPAYRWYGYGTTTPGANPLAPTGQYPKGSANWYAQTGATPGAFPVPVTAGGEPIQRFEPPVYAATPQPPAAPAYAAQPPRDTRPVAQSFVPPAPSFVPPVASRPTATNVPPMTVIPPPPLTLPATEPVRPPTSEPPPIATSTPLPAPKPVPTAEAPPPAAPGLSWQSAPAASDSPTFTTAKPIATSADPPKAVTPPAADPVQFKAAPPAPPVIAPPLPAIEPPPLPALPTAPTAEWKTTPQARGQQPAPESVSIASQLRNACYGLATVAELTQTGPSTLVIRLVAGSEADARLAAANAAGIPALRPYTVRFVLERGGK